ncbi:MAG: sulfatase [Planctomycetaceae bacterium]|nr:sulfatase [Planctomycetaceae bacterium]HAA72480.1 DUF1501 domain-containing protein [Planctomycetaceae bacterium]|tara:strand:+ start:10009 stop:11445 length:1437 start_codon:yes stop_codon:yes gene_type:complete
MPAEPFSRRQMLRRCNIGFGSLALASILGDPARGATAGSPAQAAGAPHHAPRAKRMIFLFMKGGPSQMDTFDPKPQLQKDHGKPLPIDRPRLLFHSTADSNNKLFASPWSFRQHGQSGLPVSSLFPQIASCVDDLCVIRSLHGTNPAHGGATLKMHTGSDTFIRPSLGSWLSYGLGTENDNLPAFITISPTMFHGGVNNYGTAFLPAVYQGTPLGRAGSPVRDARFQHIHPQLTPVRQRLQLDFVQDLNRRHHQAALADSDLEARIEALELAYRMQTSAPQVQDTTEETETTRRLYGIDEEPTRDFGYQCLLARRFIEQGVRMVQVTHQNGSGHWDQHGNLLQRHPENAREVDRPIAGLLKDLKRRGLLEDTLVLWGGEFGRTPTAEEKDQPSNNGRDHNPSGFTMWLAGGGVKGGFSYGATDDYGYFAVEDKVHIHDLHATILHLLGIDHTRLTYPFGGRDFRLTDVSGDVVEAILA